MGLAPCAERHYRCPSCGAALHRDKVRKVWIDAHDADGRCGWPWHLHQCPPPNIENVRECSCGFVVFIVSNDLRLLWPSREPHSEHPPREQLALDRWYEAESKRAGVEPVTYKGVDESPDSYPQRVARYQAPTKAPQAAQNARQPSGTPDPASTHDEAADRSFLAPSEPHADTATPQRPSTPASPERRRAGRTFS